MDGAKALLHATNPFLLDWRGAAPAAPAGELIFPPFNATASPRRAVVVSVSYECTANRSQ